MKAYLLFLCVLTPAQTPPAVDAPLPETIAAPQENILLTIATVQPPPPIETPPPEEVVAPHLPPAKPPVPITELPKVGTEELPSDRWAFMEFLQGTWFGWLMDNQRLSISGWANGSYTPSTTAHSNSPITWNDRANTFLLQQGWARIERSVVTSGTQDPTWGFRIDVLTGSDYRFTLPRGFWNSQLVNSNGTNNLYGVDLVQHYLEFYVPTFMNGLDLKVGHFYTPWGMESIEAVSTPFISRSYAFNWSPPFTHFGAMATLNMNSQWTAQMALVNGNDVYIGDPSEEWRYVGTLKYVTPDNNDTVTLATSVGRGKFDASKPFAPATFALMDEPFGRNNFNAFDIVYSHIFNPRWTYSMEGIYGYQTNVPGIANSQGYGNAHWFAVAQYLFYNVTPKLTYQIRVEEFEDCEGQRTGFPGLYSSGTVGFVYKVNKATQIRWEARGDYNGYSRPVEGGKHGIAVSAMDFIVRW